MSNPTSNFGWQMPTNTDLVTDLPADFEVFGQGVDTTLADLKGGTTGQILSKATNADMDFTWTNLNPGDITGVTATSPLTGGGTSGDVTVGIQDGTTSQKGAVQLEDSTSSTSTTKAATANAVKSAYDLANSKGVGTITGVTAGTGITGGGTSGAVTVNYDISNFGNAKFVAGRNAIINGDFGIWQRGTSFTNPAAGSYLADRFGCGYDGSGATRIFSQQTFTPGTAPVSGYEAQYYFRLNQSVAGTGGTYNLITQPIEDVRTFAEQTVTISFWAKAAANFTFGQIDMYQYFGSGGSGAVTTAGTSSDGNVTTSWKRFTYNVSVPSVSGKTIGAGSYVQLRIWLPTNTTFTFDIWGVQVESGSTASPFQTATGTKQGELAACQRYYWRFGGKEAYQGRGAGCYTTTTNCLFSMPTPVTMRVSPSISTGGTFFLKSGGDKTITSIAGTSESTNPDDLMLTITTSTTSTAGYAAIINASNSLNSYIEASAEL